MKRKITYPLRGALRELIGEETLVEPLAAVLHRTGPLIFILKGGGIIRPNLASGISAARSHSPVYELNLLSCSGKRRMRKQFKGRFQSCKAIRKPSPGLQMRFPWS